jgi:hypothetical protein
MKNYFLKRKCLAAGIIVLFIAITMTPGSTQHVVRASNDSKDGTVAVENQPLLFGVHPERSLLLTFHSYITVSYNAGYVQNTTFLPGEAYSIPFRVGYRADIPPWFLASRLYLFQVFKNWFLFHTLIAPVTTINISTADVPAWVDVYPSLPNIIVGIENEFCVVDSSLIVILPLDAPPGPFAFQVNAEAPAFHRINGYLISISIPITVQTP